MADSENVAPAAMHATLLLRGHTGGAAVRTALGADAALLAYGLLGQMLAGTYVTYREARTRRQRQASDADAA